MHLDVLDLRNFYYRTRLGRAVQKVIRDEVTAMWTHADGLSVAGFGFAVPLMRPYIGKAERTIGLMPGPQGVMPWPAGQPNVSVLCEETLWPIQTGQVDRLLVLHGLETSENPQNFWMNARGCFHPMAKRYSLCRTDRASGHDGTKHRLDLGDPTALGNWKRN